MTLSTTQRATTRSSIRTQIIAAMLFATLFPLLTVGVLVAVSNPQSQQDQVRDQLEAVVTLKEQQLITWRDSAQDELDTILAGSAEYEAAINVLENRLSDQLAQTYNNLRLNMEQRAEQSEIFDTIFLVNPQGQIILSTNLALSRGVVSGQPYFIDGREQATFQPPSFDPLLSQVTAFVARPVRNDNGQVSGVIAAQLRTDLLNQVLDQVTGMPDGDVYLLDRDGQALTSLTLRQPGDSITDPDLLSAIQSRTLQLETYLNPRQSPVIGMVYWSPAMDAVIVAEREAARIGGLSSPAMAVFASIGLTTVAIAALAALLVSRQFADPVIEMTESVKMIADGELLEVVSTDTDTELDELGQSINAMLVNLQNMIGDLETRVIQQNDELERKSGYLEASTKVSQAVTTIQDPARLVQELVELMRYHYDLYYVGLFLVDENEKYAVLRAATGSAGEAMLNRGHRLAIGEGSMIGWTVANGRERIALQANEDPVRLATPELPLTRSEAALPLRSRGQVIGAISVQSTQAEAFNADTINALQTMADQVAAAIDNARLYDEARNALQAAQRAYGQVRQSGWERILYQRDRLGFKATSGGVTPAEQAWHELDKLALNKRQPVATSTLDDFGRWQVSIPLFLGDLALGVIRIHKNQQAGPWTTSELKTMQAVAEQMIAAMESSRLYSDTQRRAEYEQITGRITANLRQTLDVETILKAAAIEVRQAFNLPEVSIRLAPADTPASDAQSERGVQQP